MWHRWWKFPTLPCLEGVGTGNAIPLAWSTVWVHLSGQILRKPNIASKSEFHTWLDISISLLPTCIKVILFKSGISWSTGWFLPSKLAGKVRVCLLSSPRTGNANITLDSGWLVRGQWMSVTTFIAMALAWWSTSMNITFQYRDIVWCYFYKVEGCLKAYHHYFVGEYSLRLQNWWDLPHQVLPVGWKCEYLWTHAIYHIPNSDSRCPYFTKYTRQCLLGDIMSHVFSHVFTAQHVVPGLKLDKYWFIPRV